MANKDSAIIVNGYAFSNSEDAVLAEGERKKVELIKSKMASFEPDKVLAVYNKAINDRIFRTPVGLEFLREMQTYLLDQCDYTAEEVEAIPLYMEYNDKPKTVTDPLAKQRIAQTKKKKEKEKVPALYVSVVLNIALVIAVIAMFVITLKSDNPNILNYETNITNKYSYWEQELSEKEQALRERERIVIQKEEELNLDSSSVSGGN